MAPILGPVEVEVVAGAGGHSELDVMAVPHHRISLVGRERAALAANHEDVRLQADVLPTGARVLVVGRLV